MILLPFEKITFKSPLTKKEALERLSEKVDSVKYFRGFTESKITKPYEGKIVEDKFFIKRIITYRNSFLPRIKGIIKSDGNETT